MIANSRLARALCAWMPSPALASDIAEVLYVNFLIRASDAERLVAPPLRLQTLGPGGEHALFTILVFRHGHFGPAFLGPLRALFASPVQSNWRLYVEVEDQGVRGVQFLTTTNSNTVYALATRLLVADVSMHVPRSASVASDASGSIRVHMESGAGSAPDLAAMLSPCAAPAMEGAWRECFGDFGGLVAYSVPQDRALVVDPLTRQITGQEITLTIPPGAVRPVTGEIRSRAVRAVAGDSRPVCFVVNRVGFRFAGAKRI
jgi:hypothetical protein